MRALRWGDVDFAKLTIIVRASFTHGEAGAPKSGKIRSVPPIDQAGAALDGLSKRELFTGPDDLVFPSPTGSYLDETALRRRFYDALIGAGLGHLREKPEPIVFHDLRHTFGTLGAAVWPLHDLQGYMGHADIQTTMIYVHRVPKIEAADQLTAAVEGANGTVSRSVSRNAEFEDNSAQLSATNDA